MYNLTCTDGGKGGRAIKTVRIEYCNGATLNEFKFIQVGRRYCLLPCHRQYANVPTLQQSNDTRIKSNRAVYNAGDY